MFVDSHAHLDTERFESDWEEVLQRASDASVQRVLCIACAAPESPSLGRVLQLAENRPEVYAALGVHPHDAGKATPELLGQIQKLMSVPRVLAWGEIGLDYYYDTAPREEQLRIFRWQLAAARELGKPVIIHSRDASDDTCRCLEKEVALGLQGVMHCFTYGKEVAARCLDLDFYLGFGGIVTFPRSQELQEVAREVAAERLLIETDSPYLAPVPYRGKRNEPAYVVEVAKMLARLRGTTPDEIGRQTTENFQRLFRPPA